MLLAEVVLNKFQDTLGANYKLFLGNAFNRKFTETARSIYGDTMNYKYQAFNEYKNQIVTLFSLAPSLYSKAPFLSYNTKYTIQFWVPLNNLKINSAGENIEEPTFNIYDDIKALREALDDTVTFHYTADYTFDTYENFTDWLGGLYEREDDVLPTDLAVKDIIGITEAGYSEYEVLSIPAEEIADFKEIPLRGLITWGEPIIENSVDKTASWDMSVVTLTGDINLTDWGILPGDRTFEISLDGGTVYVALPMPNEYRINANSDGTTSQNQGDIMPTLDGQSIINNVTLLFDSYVSTNTALTYLQGVGSGKTVDEDAFSLPFKIKLKGTLEASYNAQIDVAINRASGTERLEVAFVRVEE